MRYLLLFMFLVAVILWAERYYYKRRAELLENRLVGDHRSESVRSLIDAWIDGRIEARLQKRKNS